MMTIRCIGLLCVLQAAVFAQAPAGSPVVIENDRLRVSFAADSGTLLDVYDKQKQASYLSPRGQQGWFRIQIPVNGWEGHAPSSNDLPQPRVTQPAGNTIEVRSERLQSAEGEFQVATQLSCRLEDVNLICRLQLENRSDHAIDRVIFPIVNVPEAADGREAVLLPHVTWPLRFFFSENEVRTERNPFETVDASSAGAWFHNDPRISRKGIDYPRHLPTAWVQYNAGGRSVAFDVRDRKFQFQRFMVERRLMRDRQSRGGNRRDYQLTWNWFPMVRQGESWQSAEVYVRFGDDDWHPVARQRREWLRTWAGGPKPAEGFKTSIGWISRGIRSFDEIPKFAKQGVDVGAPYFIVYGWSEIGPQGMSYGNYPRSELGGVEALKRNLREARQLGAYPMPWFNGTLSVETNLGHAYVGREWIALTRWGGEMVEGRWSFFEPFQIVTLPNNDLWLHFDPSTDVREYWLDQVKRWIHEYGFTGFQMDQAYKNFLSYRSRTPELAFTQGYGDFYRRAQEIVKGADPNGVILGENYNEHMNQYADSTWIFEGGALNVQQQSRFRYSLPWITVSTRAVATDRGHANQAFLLNAPLDIFDDLDRHREYAQHLRRLHALKKATARYFFEGEYSDGEGFRFTGGKTVLARSYRDPNGRFAAIVVVNASGDAAEAELQLEPELAGAAGRHLYLDGRSEGRAPGGEARLRLGPYDVQVITLGEVN